MCAMRTRRVRGRLGVKGGSDLEIEIGRVESGIRISGSGIDGKQEESVSIFPFEGMGVGDSFGVYRIGKSDTKFYNTVLGRVRLESLRLGMRVKLVSMEWYSGVHRTMHSVCMVRVWRVR